mmetsp:Transcript_23807/g.56593  ORF Transcript_23807/g.56593 Transcript_23807/m.56593 type:complete len:209 (-) Transcript_23807:192-818(-)
MSGGVRYCGESSLCFSPAQVGVCRMLLRRRPVQREKVSDVFAPSLSPSIATSLAIEALNPSDIRRAMSSSGGVRVRTTARTVNTFSRSLVTSPISTLSKLTLMTPLVVMMNFSSLSLSPSPLRASTMMKSVSGFAVVLPPCLVTRAREVCAFPFLFVKSPRTGRAPCSSRSRRSDAISLLAGAQSPSITSRSFAVTSAFSASGVWLSG